MSSSTIQEFEPAQRTISCRDCGHEVSSSAAQCPACGAPRPWQPDWNGTGVDWKSPITIGSLPLVHVAFGTDKQGKRRVAKGVIAIGQFAVGYVVIAQFGFGIVGITQFGAFAVGISQFSLAVASISQLAIAVWSVAQLGIVAADGIGQKIIKFADLF